MRLRSAVVLAVVAGLLGSATVAASPAVGAPQFTPGAAGVGDPYFPLAGNGGYDVERYSLKVGYEPSTDVLTGRATIFASATQHLSRFNLDLAGLTVRSVQVDGRPATWTRDGGELIVTPRVGIYRGHRFRTVVTYDGVPQRFGNAALGESGFFHTDDGALVVGQPDVAASWFPVNDHPVDKAAFDIAITVPAGLQAVSNGTLTEQYTVRGKSTWRWRANEPMAPYLSMMAIGEFDISSYRKDGIRFLDALDPDLFDPVAEPRTGSQYALSNVSEPSYKRLSRTIAVPAAGASLSFWVARETELNWDHFFVEARRAGQDDWTTLPDEGGRTTQDTGLSCPYWLELHPFLARYQTEQGDSCAPSGSTGDWWSVSGSSDGYEQWEVDLSAYAGDDVEVSLSYVSDDLVQRRGVFIDDVVVSTGEGSTSFEADDDPSDGWTVSGAPAGSAANPNDWTIGTVADSPPSAGNIAEDAFARQPEVIDFLSDAFGRYPFSASGGVVDDFEGLGFALETQTRPIYSVDFFSDPVSADSVVVHELAHQWFGDSLALGRWQDIWLNEGFATYAEWMWSEREGLGTAQEIFDAQYARDADSPFWLLEIGDPGPENLFSGSVYDRGAMTLHALRLEVGDDAFFRLLRTWARSQAGGNVTTAEFITVAERVSGRQLDALFDAWLFTATKPAVAEVPAQRSARTAVQTADVPSAATRLLSGKVMGRR